MRSKNKHQRALIFGVMSLGLGIISVVCSFLVYPSEKYDDIFLLLLLISIAIGIRSIFIARSIKFKRGVILGRLGVGIAAFFFLAPVLQFISTIGGSRFPCSFEIKDLSKVMQYYCSTNKETLPNAGVWCDQIIESVKNEECFSQNSFVENNNWGGPEDKICDFAFNINLDGCKLSMINRPVVLLFEAERVWNQNGTSDILRKKGHPGLGRLFEGGYHFVLIGPSSEFIVEFIKYSELGDLNWTP